MATSVGDVTGLQQRHHPWNIPPLVKKIKGFPLKSKSFQNTATYQKTPEGAPSTPSPLYPGGGMNLHVRLRFKILNNHWMRLNIIWRIVEIKADVTDNTLWDLHNSSDDTKAELNIFFYCSFKVIPRALSV